MNGSRSDPEASPARWTAYPAPGCWAEENCEKATRNSPAAFPARWGKADHCPPLGELAAALAKWVTTYSVSEAAEYVTHGALQKCELTAWVKSVPVPTPTRACA